ncbi:hypothetical protein F5876DRAFT_83289 [Lentinula aff. lateritia]|uniref:Uncharacterized protein n=1 Tax=Lentinula aff. lateritia TaxID=2804960 RepID=A0ACC1TI16_9AGAR|nr:hypothetical protein F5876DRAFT_83289 [Lentinula aff. lateritia]
MFEHSDTGTLPISNVEAPYIVYSHIASPLLPPPLKNTNLNPFLPQDYLPGSPLLARSYNSYHPVIAPMVYIDVPRSYIVTTLA